MPAVALAPTAPREAVIAEVNLLTAAQASAGNVSAAAALRIVRGRVNSAGAVVSGEGFTSALGATGVYTVTFTTPFAVAPAVVTSCDAASCHQTVAPAVGAFVASTTALEDPVNSGFSFIAIGAA